ncbi:MAG: transglutaminase-like domain-containing protein [Syntrophales bacterium]|nr:transglutaminase-like domain-containing protein [Syntrophales bacterium]
MEKDIKYWLKEGKQSKITKNVEKLASKFSGNDFEKIQKILNWMGKNLKSCKDYKKVLKIFATRNVDKILKDGFITGCHDNALIFATLCRAVGIPAKYITGIDKLDPKNRGHCAVEVYINNTWIIVDQSRKIITLDIKRSDFYKQNYIIAKSLDSWEAGIKTFKNWKDKSEKIVKVISKINTSIN